ncbi:SET and MYND domaincontaining protein 4like, partial [Caligus rogercresseyi]
TIRDLLVLRQNVEPILSYFQTLLNEMENSVRHPDSKYILCQQVISQCYGIKGTVISLHEKKSLPPSLPIFNRFLYIT